MSYNFNERNDRPQRSPSNRRYDDPNYSPNYSNGREEERYDYNGYEAKPTKYVAQETFIETAEYGDAVTLPRNASVRKDKSPAQDYPRDLEYRNEPAKREKFEAYDHSQDNYSKGFKFSDGIKSESKYPSLRETKEKRFMYGCIPVNKKSRNICVSVVLVLGVLISVIGFLFFPRMPQIKVLNIDPKSNTSFTVTPYDSNSPTFNFNFTLDMVMNISVLNTNKYHFKLESIDMTAYVMANASQINADGTLITETVFNKLIPTGQRVKVDSSNNKVKVGYGKKNGPLTFPAGKNVTFTMDFKATYTAPTNIVDALNDPLMNEILQLCYLQDPTRHTTIHYETSNDISMLKYIGVTPNTSGDLSINCPFQGDQLAGFLKALNTKGK
ncbi:hypothetical protein HDV01_007450 [Terramyces sp. JEL0728]|nr:hypothetical protein HDV01_007450 [Terramyces sp. JEL0728]